MQASVYVSLPATPSMVVNYYFKLRTHLHCINFYKFKEEIADQNILLVDSMTNIELFLRNVRKFIFQ